ncbi:hypothetical protein MMC07_003047 [Pseudocyphellaria aurata]|nr:hypothetical protein [Pseudocyphellaria aurata]
MSTSSVHTGERPPKSSNMTGSTIPAGHEFRRERTKRDHEAIGPIKKSPTDHFNGKSGWSRGHFYKKPNRQDVEMNFYNGQTLEDVNKFEHHHRDFYGRETYRPRDLLRYISPTDARPRRLIVQATPSAMAHSPAGDWRRKKLSGDVPMIFKLSEWALSPSDKSENGHRKFLGILNTLIRTCMVAPVLLTMLSLPFDQAWANSDFQDTYNEFPNYFWDYPKYAKNRMDMQPIASLEEQRALQKENLKDLSYKVRLRRPRQLVVFKDGVWRLHHDPHERRSYIFVSWTSQHFKPWESQKDCNKIEQIARNQVREYGLSAYWLDVRCLASKPDSDLYNADVYRMCDVIRGAHLVCVVLPHLTDKYKREWGSRLWTLPEAMLSQRSEVKFCSPEEEKMLTKLDMTDEIWTTHDGQGEATRLLAEHYSSVLTLGRLELFAAALESLAAKRFTAYIQDKDNVELAYALMGFLNRRVQLDGSENLFQALARLSLENDTDGLVERMICMFPDPDQSVNQIMSGLIGPDQYGARLWDIQPLCQVSGIGQNNEIIVDQCRGVSIRWKAFPQMQYKRGFGLKRLLSEIILRAGVYTSGIGAALVISYSFSLGVDLERGDDPDNDLEVAKDIIFLAIGGLAVLFSLLLACVAPSAVRRLFGGKIRDSAPWLIGFEGVMPIKELERIVFGNYRGRLTYEPSSTPFCERFPHERLGREPSWVAAYSNPQRVVSSPPLPLGHRFFTLVDTGQLTVSIFSAVRPPSVALICGREGGMLRTLLCHYERSNNCLYRETVMRMESMTLNKAQELGWIKLDLGRKMP